MSSTISINTVFQKHATAFTSKYTRSLNLLTSITLTPKRQCWSWHQQSCCGKDQKQKATYYEQTWKARYTRNTLPWCGTDIWVVYWVAPDMVSLQCTCKAPSGTYCATCQKSADRTADGIPAYGNVEQRPSVVFLTMLTLRVASVFLIQRHPKTWHLSYTGGWSCCKIWYEHPRRAVWSQSIQARSP